MENIVIIDCGSQFTQLIARRVRELHIHSVVLSWDAPRSRIAELAPLGVIVSGGPDSVNEVFKAVHCTEKSIGIK